MNDLHALRELDARRDADVRRWVRSAAGDRDTALSLARVVPELKATAESLTLAIDRVGAVEDLDRLDIEVPGELVIERLGVAPGPIVGEAIEHLQEVRLDHGPLTEEQLLEHLDEWWRKRQA